VALVGKTRMRLHREDEIACPICLRFPGADGDWHAWAPQNR
jgi:hypothetical protein